MQHCFYGHLTDLIMALSAVGRKTLLPHGAQRKIARRLGIEESRVSTVMAPTLESLPKTEGGWQSWRRVQRAVAKALGLDVTEAFQAWERGEEVVQAIAS